MHANFNDLKPHSYAKRIRKKELLNLNYTDITNKIHKIGKYDIPYNACFNIDTIDYLALYKEKNSYFKTPNTAICFYEFDIEFDGFCGLWNAIYFGNK